MKGTYDPDSYWDDRGGDSYQTYVESADYAVYRREQDRFFTDLIARLCPERLLDFACGTGKLFPIWKPVAEVHGYDRALSQVRVARREVARVRPENPYHILHYSTGSRTELPYDDDYFDLVVAAEVLLHVLPADIDAMVAELHRVCRGHLAVVTAAPFDNPAPHCFNHDYPLHLKGLFEITDDHAVHRQRYIVGRRLPAAAAPPIAAASQEQTDALVTT
ncbi:MAG TPA: class I SAM-dependent methyltransferase [Acidobacteriota bacterium]|nr:class I SAM-dependent methyltransferase [Acidobacteriota bacterium]